MLKLTIGLAAIAMAATTCQAADASGGTCGTGLTAGQAGNARTIIVVADDLGLPIRAKVIGIATGLQESDLNEDTVGDGGLAVGVFQQHPHYGSYMARRDTERAARAFYRRLLEVSGWESRSLASAAQAVQRSAFPNAYGKHETRAERIVARLTARSCKGG